MARKSRVPPSLPDQLPQLGIASDEDCAAADGGGGEDGVVELDRLDDFAFGGGGVDDLELAALVGDVEVFPGRDGGAAEGALHPQLPLFLAVRQAGFHEHARAVHHVDRTRDARDGQIDLTRPIVGTICLTWIIHEGKKVG